MWEKNTVPNWKFTIVYEEANRLISKLSHSLDKKMAIWPVWQYMNSLFHFYFVVIDTHLYFFTSRARTWHENWISILWVPSHVRKRGLRECLLDDVGRIHLAIFFLFFMRNIGSWTTWHAWKGFSFFFLGDESVVLTPWWLWSSAGFRCQKKFIMIRLCLAHYSVTGYFLVQWSKHVLINRLSRSSLSNPWTHKMYSCAKECNKTAY